MKKWIIAFLAVAGCGFATPGMATSVSGKPVDVHIMQNGQVLFHIRVTRTSLPACTVHTTRWAFNANTMAGQAKLSLLMTAYATGKSIEVIGTGNCDQWPDTESVDYFHTLD